MVKEAETNRDQDREDREHIEARNHLDTAIFTAERSLTENRGELDSEIAREVEAAVEEAKTKLDSNDQTAMKAAPGATQSGFTPDGGTAL